MKILLRNVSVDELKNEIHQPTQFRFNIHEKTESIIICGVENTNLFLKYVSCLFIVESNMYKTGLYNFTFGKWSGVDFSKSRFFGFKSISDFSKWKLKQ